MDRVTNYHCLIKKILGQYVEWSQRNPKPDDETLLIADEERGHYMLMSVGWPRGDRALNIHVYARIHNGKVWIEEDWTEEGLANELIAEGVPKEDIVLAFQSPKMRRYTDFAAA